MWARIPHNSRAWRRIEGSAGTEKLDAVADRGYFNGEEILVCEQAGITVTLPKPLRSGAKAQGRFGKQDFVYLPKEDAYRCPAGEKLKYYFTAKENGQTLRRYWTNACRTCAIKDQCTTDSSAASRDGSMRRSSKRCRGGSMRTRTPCVSGARRSSIPSARSRCGWARRTS